MSRLMIAGNAVLGLTMVAFVQFEFAAETPAVLIALGCMMFLIAAALEIRTRFLANRSNSLADERERVRRDHAHRIAYWTLSFSIGLVVGSLVGRLRRTWEDGLNLSIGQKPRRSSSYSSGSACCCSSRCLKPSSPGPNSNRLAMTSSEAERGLKAVEPQSKHLCITQLTMENAIMLKNSLVTAPVIAMILGGSAIAAENELPDARELLDAHLEASGGVESLQRSLESTTRGRFVMPAAGIEGQMTMFSRTPTERAISIDLEGLGTMQSGYKDRQAWSVDPFMGPRLISGPELDLQIESNEPGAMYRSDEFVESMETVRTAEYNGEACFEVEVVWKSGRESTDCYSKESGFLIASEATIESPMGEMQTVTVFTDYKTFGDDDEQVILPATTNVTTMGQQQQLIIDSVELGAPADEHFELPPAIQTLKESEASD